MQQSCLLFRSQLHLSNPKPLINNNIHTIASQTRIPRPPLPHIHSDLTHIDDTSLRPKPPILCPRRRPLPISARKNQRRNGFQMPAKTALCRALFVASSLKLLPEPIDFLIRECLGGGDDEGGGVVVVDFGVWGLLLLVVVVCGSTKEFEAFARFGDLGIGVLLGMILLANLREFNKAWVLGFCSCALMVGLALKRDELQKWVKRLIGRRRRKFL
ncbi:hypothetical protein Sjap_007801 [Stephania japonica]|uniref:Uncharacterized protein n=1 Tax=Stephania japonica TaxID=461633 RepID=A0AAP0JQN1_9MAGN